MYWGCVGTMEDTKLQDYYGARALEYEQIYDREDANYQQELALTGQVLKELARDRSVLEIACGTGYWTNIAAGTAKRIVAVDIRPEVIAIARQKNLPPEKVTFAEGDAYKLDRLSGTFDFGLANFWFSHVPKNKIGAFLTGLHKRLTPGATVFIADNVYVEGRGGQLVRKDGSEDTYKIRQLSDGSAHEILKNYYSYEQLRDLFEPVAKDVTIFAGNSIWYVSYTVA